jgi:predicted outer membrane repeat protein
MKRIHIGAAILALCALVLNGCSNVFFEKPRTRPGPEVSSPDVPEGFGTIQVSFSLGAARTVMPDPVELNVLYLEYWFSKDGETAERKDPAGDIFILEPGNYNLTVKGFLTNALGPLVTEGEGAPFTIVAGTTAGTVNVTLRPIASGEGTGTLAFGLKYPAGVTVASLTLTRIGGTESYNLMSPAPSVSGANPLTLSGTKTGISVGYYLLRAMLADSAGKFAGKNEVVHIYRNLTASTDLAEYTFTAADFSAHLVTNTNDAGAGSLRQAITDINTLTGLTPTIRVMLEPGSAIELQSPLPRITKNVIIEGNGVILAQAFSWGGYVMPNQPLCVGSDAVVKIGRVHFKDDPEGAIKNLGTLTVESCIFSGTQSSAINSSNTLTIRGCTFFGNTTSDRGGAIYFDAPEKTLTIEGNLFFKNTDTQPDGLYGTRHTVYIVGGTVSASYNVVDNNFGGGSTQCGWNAGTGDRLVTVLPVSKSTFKVLYGREAVGVITSLPIDYPTKDFYGQPISANAAAGAVQAVTASGYSYLDLSVSNSQRGSMSIFPAPDEDGLVPNGSITITATSNPGVYSFAYWLVNGVKETANPYILTISDHIQIQAVFGQVMVNTPSDGVDSATTPGTLRYALTNAEDGDTIYFSGIELIELQSPLPQITENLIIEGDGVILTPAASWVASNTSQLLYIYYNAGEVTVRGIHFKDGLASNYGGAIRNDGILLTLESCIFSGNTCSANGGAIYTWRELIIRGCTFYRNTSNKGGAVYFDNTEYTLTLTGNVFYENTAGSYPVVCFQNRYSAHTNASYNVVDVDSEWGWAAGTGDTTFATLSITGDPFDTTTFVPVSGLLNVLPAIAPADFPLTDFYGAARTFPGAPGAVAATPSP